jgi:hypothetical protein
LNYTAEDVTITTLYGGDAIQRAAVVIILARAPRRVKAAGASFCFRLQVVPPEHYTLT